jgi:pyridoxamine 5'-phosphate oxidase family protein
MATFTDKELEYLRSQRLARFATADQKGAPHVVPVGFRVAEHGDAVDIGGRNFARSKRLRNIKSNPQVAIVIDDLASVDPWTPRGIEIRGIAQLHERDGRGVGPGAEDQPWARITPERVVSWGIDTAAGRQARSVKAG